MLELTHVFVVKSLLQKHLLNMWVTVIVIELNGIFGVKRDRPFCTINFVCKWWMIYIF